MAGSGPVVTVKGDKKLARAFDRLGKRAQDLDGVYRTAGDTVAETARRNAPVVSGDLRDSIEQEQAGTGVRVYFGRGLPYAGPIHFGWRERNIEPQPFLTDAFSDHRGDIEHAFVEHVDDIVRTFDREAP